MKVLAPIPVMQREKKEMPSSSEAMEYETMASCPAHFRTHWECCSWDWKKKKTSLRINANPRLSQSQNTNHTAHGHSRQVDNNEDRKARVMKSPLHPPLPRAQEGTLCQICLKSSESLAPFLSGICWRPAYADMDGLVRYCQVINKQTFSYRTCIKQKTTA